MLRKNVLLVVMLAALVLFVGQAWGDGVADADRIQPNDRQDHDWSDSDFSQGLAPQDADHLSDRYEWLGNLCDSESVVNVTDDHAINDADDDGLIAVIFHSDTAQHFVKVEFKVTTTMTGEDDPAFPRGFFEFVDCWIDWNKDKVFDTSKLAKEYIGRRSSDPNTWLPSKTCSLWIVGDVPAPYAAGQYPVRLRLDWGTPTIPVVAYSTATWGEVEDYQETAYVYCDTIDFPERPQHVLPSLTGYGMLVLLLLLVASAAWVLYSKRRRVRA